MIRTSEKENQSRACLGDNNAPETTFFENEPSSLSHCIGQCSEFSEKVRSESSGRQKERPRNSMKGEFEYESESNDSSLVDEASGMVTSGADVPASSHVLGQSPVVSGNVPKAKSIKEEVRDRTLKMVKDWRPSKLKTFERAYGGKSMRAGVNAYCFECMGYDDAAVRNCEIYNCALHPYRPNKSKK